MFTQLQIWGDSLLQGLVFDECRNNYTILKDNCVQQLKTFLPFPVKNNARIGCTVSKGYEMLIASDIQPKSLGLIEFGSNDCDMNWAAIAADPTIDHQPKTTPEDFVLKLGQCVDWLRQAGVQPMLVAPTPLHAQRYFGWVTRKLDQSAVLSFLGDIERIYRWQERYALMVCKSASKLSCPLLDLRDAFLSAKSYERFLCIDGMHPNAAGHALMLEAMKASICEAVL